jgi:PAS domain S-box-containing protein
MAEDETQAKRALRRKRFRNHLELAERAAHFGYWRFDLNDNSYYWSPGMYRLIGEDPKDRAPDLEWLYQQMTPESRAVIEQALATAIKTRSPFSYRSYTRNPDKAAQIVDTQGQVEVDDNGRTTALLGVCYDVTGQVRAEEEREKAQAMYRLMTEEASDIIILYSTDGQLLFASHALERVLGRSADEIRNGGYRNLIHPDDMDAAAKMWLRPVDGGLVVSTWRVRHGQGHYIWLETTVRTAYDPETREPKHVISVSRDVTARMEAEAAQRKAYDLFQIMSTEASDVIIVYDSAGKVLFASDALWRVLKRTPKEIEGRRNWLKNLAHPDDFELLNTIELPPKPGETLTLSYRLKHGDGYYVWLEVTTRGRYDEHGKALGLISVARDISARKQQEDAIKAAQARAEAANKAKSQFLANMSHELRTPLNAIIGFADLMRMETFGKLGDRRYSDYAILIHDSGQLLLDLISDMLDMAKIEAGKLQLNFEIVDLAGTIADTVRLLRQRADAAGVQLSTEIDGIQQPLFADRRALKQVIINLVSNAIKFTPKGGHVCVAAKVSDGVARIAVRDNGIGIPASEIHRLGKPFEQVCGDPLLAKSGTGLGLALVRALAEQHGGALNIESTEGVGTEVSVTLPVTPPNRAAA